MRISVSQLRHLHLANYLTMLFKIQDWYSFLQKRKKIYEICMLILWLVGFQFALSNCNLFHLINRIALLPSPPPSPPQASEVGRCRVNHVWYPPLLATFPDDFRISAHHVKTCFSIPALSFSEIRPGVTVFITFSFVRNCDDESIANNERI